MRKPQQYNREVYIEMRKVNERMARVVAIDPNTGTEVVMIGDLRQGQNTLKRLAARKLQYVLDKKFPKPQR